MLKIQTDRRAIDAEPDPEGERFAASIAKEYLDVRLRLAHALLRIERGGTYHLSSCSSIVQYGVRLGIPAAEARMLVDLGRALAASHAEADASATPTGSTVEDRVRSGALSVENVALVGKLLEKPGIVQPGEGEVWFARAQSMPTSELRRKVNERLEQAAQSVIELLPITLHATPKTREGFARARAIASRHAAVALTEGQTFAALVNHYLDAEDELRRGEGSRRLGSTAERPAERYVPANVRRAVLERSQDRCEVPGCPHRTFLELAHIHSHTESGSREADNLLRLCHAHHTQFDADCLAFAGWHDGHPQFRDARGALLTRGSVTPVVPRAPSSYAAPDGPASCSRTTQVSERPPPPWGALREAVMIPAARQ